jgi:hypothetical protein
LPAKGFESTQAFYREPRLGQLSTDVVNDKPRKCLTGIAMGISEIPSYDEDFEDVEGMKRVEP